MSDATEVEFWGGGGGKEGKRGDEQSHHSGTRAAPATPGAHESTDPLGKNNYHTESCTEPLNRKQLDHY